MTAFWFTPSAEASITATDDLGRKVELREPARRVVTLAPFLTELAFSAGIGHRVVGVSAFSDFPPEAGALPQVASAAGISLESLAALHPDLVLAWADTLRPGEAARIERLGPTVFVARVRRLDDVPRLLLSVASLAGADARPQAARYRERIAALARDHAAQAPVAALVEIWQQPLTTIGAEHWIDESLAVCGARNAFADLPGVAPQLGWELVYRRDPRVIIGMGPRGGEAAFRERWAARHTLSAVAKGRLVYVEADLLQRPSLRLAEGVAQLCAGIDRARR